MEDSSSTVTFTPVAVDRVKPDVDVVSTMPVAPPADGPATGPPPAGRLGVTVGEAEAAAVAVEETDNTDDEETAAADVPAVASPANAHVSPAATINPPFFFDSNRRTLEWRARTAMVAWAEPTGE
ncbi:hypothetical protein PV336_37645 [Streptomyces sp. MI02-2A]|uniref:hypothetical protein n=1 Tax=unclassified Streptomyces TaxID=2593676 RepID=UPI001F40AA88|nr:MULTISPECIES: hypothetical protein [unclassified Streptomyces]MDX3264853.1 hypothetical protein [Streptomyces sp. MI02-2A]